MTDDEIRLAIRSAIETVAPESDLQAIDPRRPLREQIDLDSLDWINFIAALSERTCFRIPASEHSRLSTIDAIVAYLSQAGAPAAAGADRESARGADSLPHRQFVVNGTAVTVRPIRREDGELEADFVRHLSTEARYKRFMVTMQELPAAKLKYLTDVDQVRHVALVAVAQREGRDALLGVVRYIVDASDANCEFAIAIDDAWQGSGLAGILMHALMDVARERGLKTMEGIVLTSNSRMLKFTRQLGFRGRHEPDEWDVVRVRRAL